MFRQDMLFPKVALDADSRKNILNLGTSTQPTDASHERFALNVAISRMNERHDAIKRLTLRLKHKFFGGVSVETQKINQREFSQPERNRHQRHEMRNDRFTRKVDSGIVKIYDALGRVVKNQSISTSENTINTSELTTGSYMVVLRTDYGNATKTLIIE